jgi:hypothetical protein
LPGFGDEYDECGEEMIHFCSECGRPARSANGDLAKIGKTCWRQECPRCAQGWALRRSYTVTAKVESLRKTVYQERGESPKFHHVVVSYPSLATAGKDPDEAAWELTKTVLQQVAVNYYGAVMIYHPFTGRSGDDRGAWKDRLFSNRDWDDVRDELKVRPHCHAIVVADSVDHYLSEAMYDQTNGSVVVHRIEKDDSNVSLYDTEDLASAATYSLSHARVASGSDAYRYTGRLANHAAGDQTRAQMRSEVRGVAAQTLDLSLREKTCSESDDDGHSVHGVSTSSSGDLLDEDSNVLLDNDRAADPETQQPDSEQPERPAGPAVCGGRLIPLDHAEAYIDEVDNPSLLRSVLDQHKTA